MRCRDQCASSGSRCAGSTNEASDTFKGPTPASEAETELVVEMSKQLRVERVLDFHSSGREVLSGYMCTAYPPQLADEIDRRAELLAAAANCEDPGQTVTNNRCGYHPCGCSVAPF